MSKEERHEEILQRLDSLQASVNELFAILNRMQHPEKSTFGLPLDPDLRPPSSFMPNQMAQQGIKGAEQP